MNKKETIKYLTELMATVQMAYFKGRMEGHPLWVHERNDGSAAISIDLYHFGGDGKPVCDGLNPCTVTFDDGTKETGNVFCMCYDPDSETPLVFLFESGRDVPDIDLETDCLPAKVLRRIIVWLEEEMRVKPAEPHKRSNEVTSFFYYMWNAWCAEECQKTFSAPFNDWKHFWSKWCGICKTHGVYGAAERFYAELSNHNRDMLVKRATEVYEGDGEKK